jgi:hypothetical protein
VYLVEGVAGEDAVGVLIGIVVLVSVLLSRREAACRRLRFRPHVPAQGEILCFALGQVKTQKGRKNKIVPGVVFRKAQVSPPLRSRPSRSVGPSSLIREIQAVKTTSLGIRAITLCRLDIE